MHTWHTWHVCSQLKKMILWTYSRCAYIHVWWNPAQARKKSQSTSVHSEMWACFAWWFRKHDRKQPFVQIRWSILHTCLRVCHRKPTPVCGSRNADNMYVYCTAHFRYTQFRAGLRGNRIAGVQLRRGWLYCQMQSHFAFFFLDGMVHFMPLPTSSTYSTTQYVAPRWHS